MSRFSSILPAALVLLLAATFGCKSTSPAPASDAAAQNPGAPAATTASNPSAAPAPVAAPAATSYNSGGNSSASSARQPERPAPVEKPKPIEKPKPVKVTLTVQSGQDINVRITETINSKTAQIGDPFSGVLTTALATQNGEVVFDKGTAVSGDVVSAKGQGRFAGSGVLAVELKEIGGHAVTATEYVVSQKGKGKRSAALIGGGAAAGAIIGGLAGGGKGGLIGGLIGGGAGTAGSAFTGNKALVIPTESIITFELSQPVSTTVVR